MMNRIWNSLTVVLKMCFIACLFRVVSMDCCNHCWSDCEAFLNAGHSASGVYHVYPQGMRTGYDVFCDMSTDGGGWLVFQRRIDGTVDFYRDWDSYARGFGNVSHEYWLGLYPLERILSQGRYELRIDMEDWDNSTAHATYNEFKIGPSTDNFRLTVGLYNGTVGDSLRRQNGHQFSTKDSDNDVYTDSCAFLLRGGWWYEACCHSNLNGVYKMFLEIELESVFWSHWKNDFYPLKTVQMKIRRA